MGSKLNYQYHKYIQNSYNSQNRGAQPVPVERPSSSNASVSEQGSPASEHSLELVKNKGPDCLQENLNPPPPRDLSKENLGIWIGWTYRSEQQLIREAASKRHVPLAIKFLSLSKNIGEDQAKEFINTEILLWVEELLSRKLIFRVQSILENIGLDPTEELQNIFFKTIKTDCRDYIGNHLRSQNLLPTRHQHLWTFLDILSENKVPLLENYSIQSLDKKSDEWKDYMAAKLFLTTLDSRLIPLVKAEILWNHLLVTNEISLLLGWIQIAYSSETNVSGIPETLLMVLKSLPLTDNMIKDLSNSNLPADDFERILNELAKFGIFVESERVDFFKVLRRVDSADSVINIYENLGQNCSNLPLIKFIPLLIDYCLENNLLIVLNSCTSNFDLPIIPKLKSSPHLDVMISFRNMLPDFKPDCLRDNICKISQYLCYNNLEKYFLDNPMIFLSLILLTKDISIEKSMDDKSLILNNSEHYPCLLNTMKHFKILSNLYFRKLKGVKCCLTYFDLLEKHLGIHIKSIFAFHFTQQPLPNFSSLTENIRYSKKVDYTFYLLQGRPSAASKKFFLDSLKSSFNIDTEKCRKKVYKVAIKNFQNTSIAASCITFLELIDVSSEFLRVSLKAAIVLLQSGMNVDNVISLFLNAEKDPKVIQTLLDENMIKFIDFNRMMSSGNEFVKAVKLYDIVVKFSMLHNLHLPDSFLRHLTQNNLWFPFLLFAQIKNYPAEQIKQISSHFKNPNLLEHIVHSVLHDFNIDETKNILKERDSRKHFLSKLGVRRSIDSSTVRGGSLKSRSSQSTGSVESTRSSLESECLEIDISNTKATLLQTLIRCHNSTDPPKALLQASQLYRNPLLAILATSYEPGSVITSWLTWLAVSTNQNEVFTNFESVASSSQQVTYLLDNCLKNGYFRTLFQSCVIFVPENPLTSFCDFLCKAINRDYEVTYLLPKLENFKSLKSQRRASVLSQTDYEMTYLKNKIWIETTALQLLCSALVYNTDSVFDQLQFVDLLCRIDIQTYFSSEVPKFQNLLTILKTIFDTGINLDLGEYLDPSQTQDTIQNCITELIKLDLFEEALEVAKCSDINTDMIVLKKWQNKFDYRKQNIENFLVHCDGDFELHKVAPEYVISFYMERASINELERYYLLKFSHKWAAKYDLSSRYDLERKKILAFIKITDKPMDISELDDPSIDIKNLTYKEILDVLQTIEPHQISLTSNYLQALTDILTEALDKSNFWLALKLERMFGCQSNDLNILKLCYELVEGLVLPSQLTEERQQVIARAKDLQKLSHRRKSFYHVTEENYLELIEEDAKLSPQATQGLIHSLIEKLTHGSDLAYAVLMKYRISCNIEVPYDVVVSHTEPFKLLKDALQDDCMNKLEVVHDFLEVFRWSKEQITDFVCDQFVSAASNYSKSKIDNFSMWDVRVAEQFHLVLKLVKDECSTLGYKFYNYAAAVHQQQVTADLDFKISDMSLVVELLIASHSCFTVDCNMEGISTILKKCRNVISHLLDVRSWKLIVRLLTGVGRYTELNFVFDILKENDQFEFLLSKGSNRDERLKLACIEYLKKYCPQNRKLYELVAVYFNLHSEVAFVWEREAQGYIKNLLAIAVAEMQNKRMNTEFVVLTKTSGTKLLLDKAMDNYVQATEFHIRGEKLSSAMNAAKQAEIIALQKSLLRQVANNETVPCLLNLSNSKVSKLLSKELNFHQSNILAQACNYTPDWSQILYEQAIVNGNMNYFDQFAETIGVTDELVQEIANQTVTRNEVETTRIKHIIERVESVHVKFRLASRLGLTELMDEIRAKSEISYLKDTLFKKKGFSASKSTD